MEPLQKPVQHLRTETTSQLYRATIVTITTFTNEPKPFGPHMNVCNRLPTRLPSLPTSV